MLDKILYLLTYTPEKLEIPFLESLSNALDDKIAGFIVSQLMQVVNWLTRLMYLSPQQLLISPQVQQIYSLITKISTASIIPIVAYQGFMVINGNKSVEELVSSLIGLWKYVIGIIVTPKLMVTILNMVNALTMSILSINGNSQFLMPQLNMALILFIVVYIYLMIQIVLYYCYRNFALMFLTVISPIILLVWSFDRGERFIRWSKEVSGLLLSQVAHVIQLILLASIISITTDGMIGFSLQIGAMLFMVKTPNWITNYLGCVDIPYVSPSLVLSRLGGIKNVFAKKFGR